MSIKSLDQTLPIFHIPCVSRDDFNHGHVDVFFGTGIGECDGADLEDGGAIMVVTHAGGDAWLGEWMRLGDLYSIFDYSLF